MISYDVDDVRFYERNYGPFRTRGGCVPTADITNNSSTKSFWFEMLMLPVIFNTLFLYVLP